MRKIMWVVVLLVCIGGAILLFRHTVGEGHQAANEEKSHMKQQNKKPPKDPLNEELSQMSLDEKVGQMIIAGLDGTVMDDHAKSLIHENRVGGFIFYGNNLTDPDQTVAFANQLKEENQSNRLPLFLSVDQEGGAVSRLPALKQLPTNRVIGQKNDGQLSFDIGKLLGKQVQSFGMNLDFAPIMDVDSNPNNPVIGDRSFSRDTSVVSQLGIQTMKGIRSEKTIPVIKHFPGHGDTAVDSHVQLPKLDKTKQQLSDVELVPFKQAIASGTDVVLIAHILLPHLDADLPSSMSKSVITNLLRHELGYDGVVITDDMTMKAITNQYDIGDAAVKSVAAGSDIILVAHGYDNATAAIASIKDAVERGEISEKQIDESVKRIMHLKKKYGVNDKQTSEVNVDELNRATQGVINRLQ